MSDPIDYNKQDIPSIIQYVNQEYPVELVFFSWQEFHHYPKAKSVKIIDYKPMEGITVESTLKDGSKVTNSLKFSDDENCKLKEKPFTKLVDILHLHLKANHFPQPGCFIALMLWLTFLLGCIAHPLLTPLQSKLEMIYLDRSNSLIVLICMAIAHFIEANLVVRELMNAFTNLHMKPEYFDVLLTWAMKTFMYGWPLTQQVYTLWGVNKTRKFN